MATQNFFALLGDDENDDPSLLLARAAAAAPVPKKQQVPSPPPPKLPTKPLPPAQAVREAYNGGRGRGRGGRGNFSNRGRGTEGANFQGDRRAQNFRNGGDYRDGRGGYANGDADAPKDDAEGKPVFDGGRGRGRGRGRGYADGDEWSGRRPFDRRSGTGRGSDVKREGTGRGNWGPEIDEAVIQEGTTETIAVEGDKAISSESPPEKKNEDEVVENVEDKKEAEEEDKEMTLEEYEKVLLEKKKTLDALKTKERVVVVDKAFDSMQLVDKKKADDVFLKLGSDKGKKKELLEKEEKARKSVSINEFLKPADGEGFYLQSRRRGRGDGRGRGGFRGGFGSGNGYSQAAESAPRIEDPGQFPTLGGK